MRRLIYISHAVEEFALEDLLALLAKSRTTNQARGITGVLFYLDGVFLQFLEGEAQAVEDTVARIRADPRHAGFVVLTDNSSSHEALLPEWKMGFYHLASMEPFVSRISPGLLENSDRDLSDRLLSDAASDSAGRLLAAFWRANRTRFLLHDR
jgi:hypothetical protein